MLYVDKIDIVIDDMWWKNIFHSPILFEIINFIFIAKTPHNIKYIKKLKQNIGFRLKTHAIIDTKIWRN